MSIRQARVGLAGLGLDTYWEQFPGLRQRLDEYVCIVAAELEKTGVAVVSLGLVDSAERGMEAGHTLRREDVDLLVLYATTYALSSTVLPMVQRARVPVLLLNLQPEAAIDYAEFNRHANTPGGRAKQTGEWLAFCSACPVPEIANVFRRLRMPFHQVTGLLTEGDAAWTELRHWMQAAQVVQSLAHARIGLMGHYYSGMLDIVTDLTAVLGTFGGHFEQIEVDTLTGLREQVTEQEIAARVQEFHETFDVDPECATTELARAARTSVALDGLVRQLDLSALAYFGSGTGVPANLDTLTSVIAGNSLLTARGVPVAGEYEVKNVLAMKVLDLLGAGGSFTEFYGIDYADDVVLMGHDGPGHTAIAEGRCKLKPLTVYHGKVGSGLSVEMSVKHGPVTLLSVVEDGAGRYFFLMAHAVCEAGPTLEIGNTNSRYRFPLSVRAFCEAWNARGPAHHCAIGVGHVGAQLTKVAALLGIEAVQVC